MTVTVAMKRCSMCGQEKPAAEFYARRGSGDGLQSRCKECSATGARSGSKEAREVLVEPELLSADRVGQLMSLGTRTVWRLKAGGQLPAPVLLGKSKRWRRSELLAWAAADCPDRKTWERMRDEAGEI